MWCVVAFTTTRTLRTLLYYIMSSPSSISSETEFCFVYKVNTNQTNRHFQARVIQKWNHLHIQHHYPRDCEKLYVQFVQTMHTDRQRENCAVHIYFEWNNTFVLNLSFLSSGMRLYKILYKNFAQNTTIHTSISMSVCGIVFFYTPYPGERQRLKIKICSIACDRKTNKIPGTI